MKVKRALISVFNKSGVEAFAKGLTEMGVTVISTGGTAKLLKDSGIPVTLVEEVTGFPEMLDGRVKTMHPRLMAGVLARRDVPGHMETIAEHDIDEEAFNDALGHNWRYTTLEPSELREMFEPFGPIEDIRVIENKGFGFVDIPEENVEAAIEATNGKELGGRTLTVNEARPRTDRPSGGGGGRRW